VQARIGELTLDFDDEIAESTASAIGGTVATQRLQLKK